MSTSDVALSLSRHLVMTQYRDIPTDTLEITKKSILDTLGVLIGASGSDEGCRKVVNLIKDMGGKEESTILGFGTRCPAIMAAFGNGSMTKTLDYDDVVGEAFVHPTAVTLPAALAVAESIGVLSGKEFLTAVTLGMDLIIRMGLSITRSDRGFRHDWHPTQLLGIFSSTAAAGKLLNLNEAQMADALGIAFLQASGSLQMIYSEGVDISLLANAFPAKAGVMSALMAKHGITGIRDCLESKAGFFQLYFQGGYDRHSLTENLGKQYELSKIGYKPWPTCRRAHTYIDAALYLTSTHNIQPDDISEVTIYFGDDFSRSLCEPLENRIKPKTIMFANTSLPFCVAAAIAKRKVVIASFQSEGRSDPITLQIAEKINPEYDSQLDVHLKSGIPAGKVRIRTKTGQIYVKTVEIPYGHPRKAMTTDDLVTKFKDCASYAVKPLSAEKIENVIECIFKLEQLDDMSNLVRLLNGI
jgi:2-methylcitrate dehydratase PrpD